MKYVIVLADGMADEPLAELDNKTPLEAAYTPNLDMLAPDSELGLVQMVPEGMAPGSDIANLSVLGYNPEIYYTGRSPLEALSIGAPMTAEDVAFRCSLVTVSEAEPYGEKRILDHSSDEIATEDAVVLLEALKDQLEREGYRFYGGTSYRHLLIRRGGEVPELTPPHDILMQKVCPYLPEDIILREMTKKSYEILNQHPLNAARRANGLNPANSIWLWGAGTKPQLMSFEEKTKKKGLMVSAVDLLKGLAEGTGMTNLTVEGANGGLHTNYAGKAKAALQGLMQDGFDFAYIHVEAPDEMGHQGKAEDKKRAIEWIDEKIIGTLLREFRQADVNYRILVLPDHPTPVRLRTHTREAVPYLLYDSTNMHKGANRYSEREAKASGHRWDEGYRLIDYLLGI